MAIYDYDSNTVAAQLTPPALRQTKFLAWLYVIVKPIQNLWALIFEDYRLGNIYTDYSGATTYNLFDKVRYTDKAIYQCIVTTSLAVECSDTTNWIKVNDIFIGADERVKYSAQKLVFEYALNNFFITSGIYIQNNFVDVGDVFVMDTDSTESSVMPLDSAFQEDYMDLTATYATAIYDYTIFVPNVFYLLLGDNAGELVTNFADKYNLAGMQYSVDTY